MSDRQSQVTSMGKPVIAAAPATTLKMRVEGMDCGACAVKIENALKRLPGVSEIDVNYGIETPTFRIDQDRTSFDAVEKKIRALGYTPCLLDGDSAGVSNRRVENIEGQGDRWSWWRTSKGRRVASTGTILIGAFLVSAFVPAISY